MLVTNFKVFITRNGNGAISYTRNKLNYKVLISKENKVLKDIFDKHYSQLEQLKLGHYAIAKWIAKDIRKVGYTFKAYSSNRQNIRPIRLGFNAKPNRKENCQKQIKGDLYKKKRKIKVSEFERLTH